MDTSNISKELDQFNFIDFVSGQNVVTLVKRPTHYEIWLYNGENKEIKETATIGPFIDELLKTRYQPQFKNTSGIISGGGKQNIPGAQAMFIEAVQENNINKCRLAIGKGATVEGIKWYSLTSADPKIVEMCLKYNRSGGENPLAIILAFASKLKSKKERSAFVSLAKSIIGHEKRYKVERDNKGKSPKYYAKKLDKKGNKEYSRLLKA